ncbi:uncharacterized protein EAF01_000971 [Botrytis porri]|uniref:Uncharacterized protein n=1 Tax=Botrytis porri TaxID=87229 RepID=A0A4Z1KL66_9HELO|nr:uncharacterized protein EAF01_000971 [Botrytis porri]KAF7914565.1 hypothetical protein EAF01_000971 [Botrytis porri]TGO86076.1 hypothetical protein BPOR_0337g00010 [Botrytis porri]
MKFIYTTSIITAILAAVAPALPVADAEANAAMILEKRGSTQFAVYTDSSCGGGAVIFTDGAATTKGNFGATQHSIKILSLTPNYHVTFYTSLNQGGDSSQHGAASVGSCVANVDFLSYGFYSGA